MYTGDDDYLEIYDAQHSYDGDRFIGTGPVQTGLVLLVDTERTEKTIRIISARRATESEARLYRQHMGMIK